MGPQTLNLSMTLHHWVNEGLMALFFFFRWFGNKREFIHGSLSSMKQAILPCFGAVGGDASSDVILYDFQPRLIQWSIGRLGHTYGNGHCLCYGCIWIF